MASARSLEDRLLEFGKRLGSPPSSSDDLYSLLDQIDSLLSRVEQSPSSSTLTALHPLLRELSVNELLRHPDMDVKAAVASCISEITRITAPDAPYDDDKMKEIFQMIVEVFETLDDTSSRSFQKRISVLETVAKVRSCVVMLDLECDTLILEMFQHFLKTIRKDHSENVFSSMETIMTLVIEESEDISSDLLSCLLNNVKHDNKGVIPQARVLVEKVMNSCAVKLKPCLLELVQSTGAPLGEYGEVVQSICRGSSEALDHSEPHGSGTVLADDSKLSERTVSDELPQASVKLEQEVNRPQQADAVANTSLVAATSNGTIHMGNGDSMEQPSSPKQNSERSRRSGQSKNAIAGQIDGDNLNPISEKPDGITDLKKADGQKANSSLQLTDTTDHSRVDSDRDAPAVTSRRGRAKKTPSSSDMKVEAVDSLEPEEKKEILNMPARDNPSSVASLTNVETPMNPIRPKRGRPPSKSAGKERDVHAVAAKPVAAAGEKDLPARTQIDIVKDNDPPKEIEDAAETEAPATVMSESEVKPQKNSAKPAGRKRKGKKQQKVDNTLGKDVAGESSAKEIASPKTPASEFPSEDEDSVKSKSRRKRDSETEHVQIYETPDCKKELGEGLVGSRIMVWWPDDKMFYQGIVAHFNKVTGKHKICYDDGEIEILKLKNERWEFVDKDSEKEETKQIEPVIASQTPPAKKSKTTSNAVFETKTPIESKSGKDAVKRNRGRPPRTAASSIGKVPNDDSAGTSRRRRGKASGRLEAVAQKPVSEDVSGPKSEAEEGSPRTSMKQEEPGNRTEDDARTKDEPPRRGRKPKKSAAESSSSKLKEETNKGSRSSGDAASKSKESTPKTARVEDDATGKRPTPKNSAQKANSTTKTSADPKANGVSDKGKMKVIQSSNTADVEGGEAATGGTKGRKRKRKGCN